jgi:hypothetical protein
MFFSRSCRIVLAIHFDQSRDVPDAISEPAMPMTKTAALDAFIAAKSDIDAMLARLVAFSAEHFQCGPDDVNWGHVGALDYYRSRLHEITDMAFCEGEHAAR